MSSVAEKYAETITLPRAVRFPVELEPPDGFSPERPETWPVLNGRLEWVEGRLLYMPPCGDQQQYTVSDVVITLGSWVRGHREFVLGTNEAGMLLGGSLRAADAALWRRSDVGAPTGRVQRHPPVLAVEVAGTDESEELLSRKASWYLAHGVEVVWLVLPASREVVTLSSEGERRHRSGQGERLPAHPALPGLEPRVEEFFEQLG